MNKLKKYLKSVVILSLSASMIISLYGCGKSEPVNLTTESEESEESETISQSAKSKEFEETADSEMYEAPVSLTAEKTSEPIARDLDEDFINATAQFSVELFKASAQESVSQGQNVLISPESVTCALAMTTNGAASDTLTEMENVISDGISIDKYNEYMLTYNNRLQNSETIDFNIANSIWIKDDEKAIKVKDDFINICHNYYNADTFMAKFDNSTVKDINSWVNDETKEMIPELLQEIPTDAVMYLINAIAFEGKWETPYEEYMIDENGIFTNYASEEQTVTMLISEEPVYLQNENSKGFIKYYEDDNYAFMAILPDKNISLNDYISDMSSDSLMELYNNRQYTAVNVRMPEFTYSYDTELSPYLSEMGMEKAFKENANFQNMGETSTGALYINKVLHKTFIEVNREGTKAAAVTSVVMFNDACAIMEEPKEVILDRPFIYGIIDTQTGLPVFLGVVNSIN